MDSRKMKRGICSYALLASVMFIFAINNNYALAASYTFENDAQGWEMGYTDDYYNDDPANWSNSKSPTPGSIYQTAPGTTGDKAYSMGLKDITNSLGNLTNGTIRADIYSSGNWENYTHARWYIATKTGDKYNMYVSKYSDSIDLNYTGWQQNTIEMNQENFFRWANSSFSPGEVGYQDFDSLLSDYDSIGLALYTADSDDPTFWSNYGNIGSYGASATSGTAEWGIDNVSSVPLPAAAWLLGSGLLGIVGLRRKHPFKKR